MGLVYVKLAFVVLHIATAATWFGLSHSLTAWGRALAGLTGEAHATVAALGGRTVRLMNVFLPLTLVFALGALFTPPGGFGVYGWPYHVSLTLLLVLLGVQFGLVAPAWRRLGTQPSGEGVGRLAAGIGIGHLVWLAILVLMFVERGVVG